MQIDDDDNQMGLEGERLLAEEAAPTKPGKRVLKGRKQKGTPTPLPPQPLPPQPLNGNSASGNIHNNVAANGAFPKYRKGNPDER